MGAIVAVEAVKRRQRAGGVNPEDAPVCLTRIWIGHVPIVGGRPVKLPVDTLHKPRRGIRTIKFETVNSRQQTGIVDSKDRPVVLGPAKRCRPIEAPITGFDEPSFRPRAIATGEAVKHGQQSRCVDPENRSLAVRPTAECRPIKLPVTALDEVSVGKHSGCAFAAKAVKHFKSLRPGRGRQQHTCNRGGHREEGTQHREPLNASSLSLSAERSAFRHPSPPPLWTPHTSHRTARSSHGRVTWMWNLM